MCHYGWLPATVRRKAAGSSDANPATNLRHVSPRSDTARPVALCPLRCPTKNLPLTTDTPIASWVRGSSLRSTAGKQVRKQSLSSEMWRCLSQSEGNQRLWATAVQLVTLMVVLRYLPTRVHWHAIQTTVTCTLTELTASHLTSREMRVFVQSSWLGSSFFLSISTNTRLARKARVLHISLQTESQTYLEGYVLVKPEARRKAHEVPVRFVRPHPEL